MNIILNNSSMKPIYEQIVDQISSQILDGTLLENTVLPSVRVLSSELRVSVLTVKKAYDALEQSGFVVTVHGKGSYVAATGDNFREEEIRKKVESEFERVIQKGRICGMTNDEMKELFEIILEEL